MFVAILTTTIPLLEKMGEDKIRSPEAYIWTHFFIISVKGMFIVTIFVINDLPSDLFLGFFFWISSTIGMVYFNYNPYFDQRKETTPVSHSRSLYNGLKQIEDRIKREVYMQKLGQAYRMVCFLTILSFSLMVAFVMNSTKFAVGTLKLTADQNDTFLPNTLALTSVIMLLYNFFAWVEFN